MNVHRFHFHRFHFHASEKIIYAPLQGIGKPQAMCVEFMFKQKMPFKYFLSEDI